MRTPTPMDWDIMARTLYGEARGESIDGKIGVAFVIKNRAETLKYKTFGDGSILSTCLADKQFSCWNETDPNRTKCLEVTTADKSFCECVIVAYKVLLGFLEDPTKGCDHYWSRKIKDPYWAKDMTGKILLGDHYFVKSS